MSSTHRAGDVQRHAHLELHLGSITACCLFSVYSSCAVCAFWAIVCCCCCRRRAIQARCLFSSHRNRRQNSVHKGGCAASAFVRRNSAILSSYHVTQFHSTKELRPFQSIQQLYSFLFVIELIGPRPEGRSDRHCTQTARSANSLHKLIELVFFCTALFETHSRGEHGLPREMLARQGVSFSCATFRRSITGEPCCF